MKTNIDYWFTIEPYVFVSIVNQRVLLYNTLDGMIIESDTCEIVELLEEVLIVANCGVILLTQERLRQPVINKFINELRDKFMGDIISCSLSKCKPIQLLPLYNYSNTVDLYKMHNFSLRKNYLKYLFEISIYVDVSTDVIELIIFLQTIPGAPTYNIISDMSIISRSDALLSYLNSIPSPKIINCSYKSILSTPSKFTNNFSLRVSVSFPIEQHLLENVVQLLKKQELPVEYIFDVSSVLDYEDAEKVVSDLEIVKFKFNPVYTGDNISFFENSVFLTKEDILSEILTVRDIFSHQAFNLYDFGKINILSNGDVYANVNYPALGKIKENTIYEIVHSEIEKGQSWFRVRNQKPCNQCVYQWLCPSPSNFEINIGRSDLCFIDNNVD